MDDWSTHSNAAAAAAAVATAALNACLQVFLRAGLDSIIMDSPQRAQISQTKSPGSVTKHGCGQCRVDSRFYCDTSLDLDRTARTKEGVKRIRHHLATLKGAALTKASMDTGVTADTEGLSNPTDDLHVDPIEQAQPEILHTDGRVS